ncbi:MAG: hypothetical protein JEZ08_10370 [Clostridiales bacterium]|nr:hypothetical protein [Clostridiales bacterium]
MKKLIYLVICSLLLVSCKADAVINNSNGNPTENISSQVNVDSSTEDQSESTNNQDSNDEESTSNDDITIEEDEMVLQQTTENFIFYSFNKDKECIELVSALLEENLQRLAEKYDAELSEHIIVNIYPDFDSLEEARGKPNMPKWVVGFAKDGKLSLLSPYYEDIEIGISDFKKVAVHELVHIVTRIIDDELKVPGWFGEGFSVYESGQFDDYQRKSIYTELSNEKLSSIDGLYEGTVDASEYYRNSASIVEYIVSKYGEDIIPKIIKSTTDPETTIGITREEFEREWRSFIQETYDN